MNKVCFKETISNLNPIIIGPFKFFEPYEFTFKCISKGRWYGKKLIDVFDKEFHQIEREILLERINNGKILVNNKKINIDYIIQEHDLIEHTSLRIESPIYNLPIEKIGETNDFVAFFKPSSIPIHAIGGYFYNSMVKQIDKRYFPVHRLDRVTSGIVILAKNKESARKFTFLLNNNQIKKTYIARVKGIFPENEIIVDKPIIESNEERTKRDCIDEGGKESKTLFKRINTNGIESIVECHPITGRTHQIRVHLSHIGFPISNDFTYGGNSNILNNEELESLNIAKEKGILPNEIIEQQKSNILYFKIWLCSIKYESNEFCFELNYPDWAIL